MKFVARWIEAEAMPGEAPAAGAWVPMDFDQARTVLATQLRTNLGRWARPETWGQYEGALDGQKATEQEYPNGLVITCRDHVSR